jgi:hypothetical protein
MLSTENQIVDVKYTFRHHISYTFDSAAWDGPTLHPIPPPPITATPPSSSFLLLDGCDKIV